MTQSKLIPLAATGRAGAERMLERHGRAAAAGRRDQERVRASASSRCRRSSRTRRSRTTRRSLRSPFVPSAPARSDVANAVRPDVKRPREFLEQFPLDTHAHGRHAAAAGPQLRPGAGQGRARASRAAGQLHGPERRPHRRRHAAPEYQSSRSSPTVSADTSSVRPRWR